MKRIFVLCDGTWQSAMQPTATNVLELDTLLARRDSNGIVQVILYNDGVGVSSVRMPHLTGGAFGTGLDDIIRRSYENLLSNYEKGDEVYLVGFSRGAYEVRRLAGMIRASGLLPPKNITHSRRAWELFKDRSEPVDGQAAIEFRRNYESTIIPIKALFCFDTVGDYGIPAIISQFNQLHPADAFHDTLLSRCIENAYHAMALDEHRQAFMVTPMEPSPNSRTQVVKQVWFPGCHSDVGGGDGRTVKLANGPLLWMVSEFERLGVAFDEAAVNKTKADPDIEFYDSASGFPFGFLPKEPRPVRRISTHFHHSVFERLMDLQLDYEPSNIDPEMRLKIKRAGQNAPKNAQVLTI